MSLVDRDNTNANRGKPTVNSNDGVGFRMAHNTNQTTYRASGGAVTQRMVFKQGLIMTVDNDDNISSVYGYIPEVSSVPVFIIAREGFDVFVDVLNGEVERPKV